MPGRPRRLTPTAPAVVPGIVRSADGTALAFDRTGEGPPVILGSTG